MNAGALVYCLLDAEGAYTPEGYELLDSAHVGSYELKLWRGTGHIKGKPVKFNEVSLNMVGRSFDPESQNKRLPGSVLALGGRKQLMAVLPRWIVKFGELYIGSHNLDKLRFYHKFFTTYLRQLSISKPYAPFDECEGVPEYFLVTGGREWTTSDAERYLKELPSTEEQATARAVSAFEDLKKKGSVNEDNLGDIADNIVGQVVYECGYVTGNEVVDIDFFNTVLTGVLRHASSH